jgi:hypothetical protein
MRPYVKIFLISALCVLAGCAAGVQTHSSPEHDGRALSAEDLRKGGIGFLTPSSITGHEEDKQALAHAFASALRTQRPDVKVLPLSETIGAVNRAGLAGSYRSMYADYRDSAVFDAALMRQIAKAAGVRYLAQLKLASVEQGDGSIAWEGLNEVSMAMETAWEEPMTFQSVADRAAQDLVKRLPN